MLEVRESTDEGLRNDKMHNGRSGTVGGVRGSSARCVARPNLVCSGAQQCVARGDAVRGSGARRGGA